MGKDNQKSMGVARQSMRVFGRRIPGFVVGILLGVVVNGSIALLPLIPTLLIDRIITPALGGQVVLSDNLFSGFLKGQRADDYVGSFLILAGVFLVLMVAKHGVSYGRWLLLQSVGTKGENDLREKVFGKMVAQNGLGASKYTSGDLITICTSDIVVVKDFYADQVVYFFGVLTFWGLSAYFLLTIHWLLILCPLVGGVLSLVCMRWYTKTSNKRYAKIRDVSGELSTTVQENIQGVRVVRAYATESIEQAKFDKQNEGFRQAYLDNAKTQAKYTTIFNAIGSAIMLGSMGIAIYLALESKLTIGQFATFFAYINLISFPFYTLAGVLSEYQNFVVSGKRLFGFLNAPNSIQDGKLALQKIGSTPSIVVRDASVSEGEQVLLRDISVDLPYGKKLGIMGRTGSGKTVFIKALCRFFDMGEKEGGVILVDGVDVRDLGVEEVRRVFGYVMQDVFLFSDTVHNNIAFYEPGASLETVQKVAKIACADLFVTGLQDGYDTIIGEKGVGLSGGQKQRLSIARALLKNAPVLLFDDCTSALDMETEQKILQGIKEHYPDRTLVIASHRASSVKHCDEILYFEDGAIVEKGSHEELLALGGRYATVYQAQEAARVDCLD